jgi:hypothetical protein
MGSEEEKAFKTTPEVEPEKTRNYASIVDKVIEREMLKSAVLGDWR